MSLSHCKRGSAIYSQEETKGEHKNRHIVLQSVQITGRVFTLGHSQRNAQWFWSGPLRLGTHERLNYVRCDGRLFVLTYL
jgi:hypothetical protein